MQGAIILVLEVVFGAWISISSMMWIYWTFKPHKRPSQSEVSGSYLVFVGALLGYALFFSGGFYAALFFIPHSWGRHNHDGEFVHAREDYSDLLGVVASFVLICLLDRIEKLVDENQYMKSKLDEMRDEARNNTEK